MWAGGNVVDIWMIVANISFVSSDVESAEQSVVMSEAMIFLSMYRNSFCIIFRISVDGG